MRVLYYTSTAYLDIALEVIQVLKQIVELHVLIEITQGTKNLNIVDIETLPEKEVLVDPAQLLKPRDQQYLQPYFDGVKSVQFIVHAQKSVATSLRTSLKAYQFIKKIKPDIFHLEALEIRSVGLLPSLFLVKKLFISIHDPVLHSGEGSWKVKLTRFSFYHFPVAKGYFLYSQFAKEQFDHYQKNLKSPRYVLHLHPYSYYRNYLPNQLQERKHILFFGRLSPYKGIDVLLQAVPMVFEQFPQETLVIAGNSFAGYELDKELIEQNKEHIILMNRYITNEELVSLISQAKFIVCPYKDATQSGVLMTAFALNTPVIATNVGAFPEHIEEGVTGMLVPVNDAKALAQKMIAALCDDYYQTMIQHLINKYNNDPDAALNKATLLKAYTE